MILKKRKVYSESLSALQEIRSLPVKKRKLRIPFKSYSNSSDSQNLNRCFLHVGVNLERRFREEYKHSLNDVMTLLSVHDQYLLQQVQQEENINNYRMINKRNIPTCLVQKQVSTVFDAMWKERYDELVIFWKKHGHSCVPQRYPPNKALGKWVHKQRQEHKKKRDGLACTLTLYRIESLEKVNFQFDPTNRAEGLWQRRYKELVHFMGIHGHCMVPQKYPSNKALGKWVHRQRHEFSKKCSGEASFMTEQRIEALNKLGFQWSSCRSQSSTQCNAIPQRLFQDHRNNEISSIEKNSGIF